MYYIKCITLNGERMESLNSGNGRHFCFGSRSGWTKLMVENTHINIEQARGDYRNWKYMAFCQTGGWCQQIS